MNGFTFSFNLDANGIPNGFEFTDSSGRPIFRQLPGGDCDTCDGDAISGCVAGEPPTNPFSRILDEADALTHDDVDRMRAIGMTTDELLGSEFFFQLHSNAFGHMTKVMSESRLTADVECDLETDPLYAEVLDRFGRDALRLIAHEYMRPCLEDENEALVLELVRAFCRALGDVLREQLIEDFATGDDENSYNLIA